jgi:hypothetical protein
MENANYGVRSMACVLQAAAEETLNKRGTSRLIVKPYQPAGYWAPPQAQPAHGRAAVGLFSGTMGGDRGRTPRLERLATARAFAASARLGPQLRPLLNQLGVERGASLLRDGLGARFRTVTRQRARPDAVEPAPALAALAAAAAVSFGYWLRLLDRLKVPPRHAACVPIVPLLFFFGVKFAQ